MEEENYIPVRRTRRTRLKTAAELVQEIQTIPLGPEESLESLSEEPEVQLEEVNLKNLADIQAKKNRLAIQAVNNIVNDLLKEYNDNRWGMDKNMRSYLLSRAFNRYIVEVKGKIYDGDPDLQPRCYITNTVDCNYFAGRVSLGYSTDGSNITGGFFYLEELNKNCSTCALHHFGNINYITSDLDEFNILMYLIKQIVFVVLDYTVLMTTITNESSTLFSKYYENKKPLKTIRNKRNSHQINYYLETYEN